MKPILKYITLLLASGVIIPFCSQLGAPNSSAKPLATSANSVNKACYRDSEPHFSFVHDVAEKLLPVLTFLK